MIVRIPLSHSYSRVVHWASSALLMLGCVGLGIYFWSELDARIYQESQNRDFTARAAPAGAPAGATPEILRDPLKLPPRFPWTLDPQVIGRLEIPRIRLAVIVREGVDPQTLRRAAGHMPGTALPGAPGNFVVAGHRDTFFRKLRLVQPGDEIRVTTANGGFRYEVEELLVVDPDAVDAIQPGAHPACTLITCFPFDVIGSAPRRMLVRARQKEY